MQNRGVQWHSQKFGMEGGVRNLHNDSLLSLFLLGFISLCRVVDDWGLGEWDAAYVVFSGLPHVPTFHQHPQVQKHIGYKHFPNGVRLSK